MLQEILDSAKQSLRAALKVLHPKAGRLGPGFKIARPGRKRAGIRAIFRAADEEKAIFFPRAELGVGQDHGVSLTRAVSVLF
jgi:hypothetical protein